MKPLSELPRDIVRAVFTDLDDTLTDDGLVESATYDAIFRLKHAGLRVVVVSGRPAAWADCLMRLWPLDAMVFENGAGVMVREGKKVATRLLANLPDAARLDALVEKIQKKFPGAKLAADQRFRLFDRAVDFGEEPPYLGEKERDEILRLLAAEKDVTAKLSSIHINFWIGTHTKVTAAESLLGNLRRDEIVYCGDSPNDEPLFAHFPLSVGVANVAPFLPALAHPPRFLTPSPRGAGFRELTDHLVSRKRSL